MVRPTRRRQGVASALTHARLECIWSQADYAYYFTNEHNIASIRLLETFGFRARGSYCSLHGVTADNGQSNLVLFAASP
jgi:aminoglycoside 6'-N-acetyltransferase I